MIDRQDNYTIKKSNLLIEQNNKLSILPYKFFNLLINKFQTQDIDTLYRDFNIKEIQNLIGSEKNYQSYGKIRKIAEALLTQIIELIKPKLKSFNSTTFASSVKLENGMIRVYISESLKSLIDLDYIHPDNKKTITYGYTPINLSIVNSLKSKHSIALYEYSLMKFKCNTSYKRDKIETHIIINLEFMRQLLCNNHKSYENFDLFHRKLLKPAIEEINNKTDLNINYTLIKCEYNNKKVVEIDFNIQSKSNILCVSAKSTNSIIDNVIIYRPIENLQQEIKKQVTSEIIYPLLVKNLLNLGVVAKKATDMYKEDNNRLQAVYDEVMAKYPNKNNDEKTRLIVSIFKSGVYPNFVSPAEKLAQEQKQALKQEEQEKSEQLFKLTILEQEKIDNEQELTKLQAKEVFNAEIIEGKTQLAQIWSAVHKLVEQDFNDSKINTWFKPAIAKINNGILNIALPNRTKLDYFNREIKTYVINALHKLQLDFRIDCTLGNS